MSRCIVRKSIRKVAALLRPLPLGRRACGSAFLMIAMLVNPQVIPPSLAMGVPELELVHGLAPVQRSEEPGYFALEEVRLPLEARNAGNCEAISAVLVQLSSSLSAVVERRSLPSCPIEVGSPSAAPRSISFGFRVPEVRRKARFEWHFEACTGKEEACQSLLRVPFVAFPRNLLAPLEAWAEANVLVVRDPDGELQSFLDDKDVQFFEHSAPSYPDAKRATLIVSRESMVQQDDLSKFTERGGVVLLREKRDGLPLVKSETKGSHKLITVELPLLSALPKEPYAQELFLEVIRLSQEEEP